MTIAISSQKGGTGKTSTSISLAAGLARKGQRTLLVDIDSQANSSKVLLPDYLRIPKEQTIYATILERKALPVRPTGIAHLAVVPSHILLSNTDVELTTAIDHREERLKRQLPPRPPVRLRDHRLSPGAVLADHQRLHRGRPGARNGLPRLLRAGLHRADKTIQEVQDYFNPQLTLAGYLFTMSDATVNTCTSSRYSGRPTPTGRCKPSSRATPTCGARTSTSRTSSPSTKAAVAYYKLIRELFHL